MTNSVDPDETPHSAASHLGLHCLLRPVCPNHMVNTVGWKNPGNCKQHKSPTKTKAI